MSDSEAASNWVQQLRDEAAVHLEDAARSDDPARRDGLIREALAMLARARALQHQADYQVEEPDEDGWFVGHPVGRTH